MWRWVVAILAAALCVWLTVRPADNPTVDAAERFNRDVAVAAGATYVSLRAINAALSTAQELEIGGAFGVSANAQPLKWLEPVDDTVERVSALVFGVTLLAGVLSLALAPVSAIGCGLLAIGLVFWALCDICWRDGRAPRLLRNGMQGAAGTGLVLGLVLPGVFALGAWVGEVLTRPAWAEANAQVQSIAMEAQALVKPAAVADDAGDPGWFRRQREAVGDLADTAGAYFGAAGTFWARSDELLQASLVLVGVFLLRMVVLPLVLLIAALSLIRTMIARP